MDNCDTRGVGRIWGSDVAPREEEGGVHGGSEGEIQELAGHQED